MKNIKKPIMIVNMMRNSVSCVNQHHRLRFDQENKNKKRPQAAF